MGYINLFSNMSEGKEISDFTSWNKMYTLGELISKDSDSLGEVFKLKEENFAARILSEGAPFLYNDKWKGSENSSNIYFLENAFNVSERLKQIGINTPNPKGLYLVKKNFHNIFYPSFVMDYIENKFDSQHIDKQGELLIRRNEMLKKAEENGFSIGPNARSSKNLVYNELTDTLYLIGFSLWKAPKNE